MSCPAGRPRDTQSQYTVASAPAQAVPRPATRLKPGLTVEDEKEDDEEDALGSGYMISVNSPPDFTPSEADGKTVAS